MVDGRAADGVETGPADIPPGFEPRRAGGPFLEPIGPIWRREEKEGGATFGLRIERRHCNSGDVAHGGMLATFADLALGIGGAEQAGTRGFVTVSLVADYLAPAPLGAWLECRPALLRRTARLIFVEGRFLADGEPVLRASGVFSLPRAP